VNAGTLTIEMAMNVARLADDMAKAKSAVTGTMKDINSAVSTVKTALGALGIGLGVGYFVSFLKGTNDAVAHMKELGQEAGTSAEAISRFEAPARSAGLSLDTVAAAMFKMSKASLEAKDPTSKASQALTAIGISTQQLKGLKPDEMFELVARSISKYSDGLEKNNVMQELVGKSGREMNRVVAAIAEKGTLAATVTEDQVAAAKKLNDQILELKMNSEKSWRSLVAEGVPALNDILKAFLDARKEGSLLDGVIAGLSMTFEKMAGNSLEQRLAAVNDRIKNIQATTATWKTSGQIEEAKNLNNLLAMRKILEGEIFDREMAAYVKTQQAVADTLLKKPKIDFDPAAREREIKRELHNMKQLEEARQEDAKNQGDLDAYIVKSVEAKIALSQKYQDIASAAAAMQIQQGEAIAQGLDTEAQIENLAYEEKLARLMAYFETKEDFTVQDQARLEALTQQHEYNLIGANSFGIKSRVDIEKMGGEQQLAYYTGTLASITAAGAQHDKKLFELNKIAGIANAIISANIGAAAALKWGWPMGPIFAGIIWAAAAANINAIRSAHFGGGTSAPSVGGGSAVPVFPAQGAPTTQTAPGAPSSPSVTVIVQGHFIGTQEFMDTVVLPAIRDAADNREFLLFDPVNSQQAQRMAPA
jgi:hypothetical protein